MRRAPRRVSQLNRQLAGPKEGIRVAARPYADLGGVVYRVYCALRVQPALQPMQYKFT